MPLCAWLEFYIFKFLGLLSPNKIFVKIFIDKTRKPIYTQVYKNLLIHTTKLIVKNSQFAKCYKFSRIIFSHLNVSNRNWCKNVNTTVPVQSQDRNVQLIRYDEGDMFNVCAFIHCCIPYERYTFS